MIAECAGASLQQMIFYQVLFLRSIYFAVCFCLVMFRYCCLEQHLTPTITLRWIAARRPHSSWPSDTQWPIDLWCPLAPVWYYLWVLPSVSVTHHDCLARLLPKPRSQSVLREWSLLPRLGNTLQLYRCLRWRLAYWVHSWVLHTSKSRRTDTCLSFAPSLHHWANHDSVST